MGQKSIKPASKFSLARLHPFQKLALLLETLTMLMILPSSLFPSESVRVYRRSMSTGLTKPSGRLQKLSYPMPSLHRIQLLRLTLFFHSPCMKPSSVVNRL